VRRLIVNADDFGLTSGVNRAIIDAHTGGIVTSATLMAHSVAFPEAVTWARAHPEISVGCHVVLVDGSPLGDSSRVASLLRHGTSRFHDSLSTFAALALRGRIDPAQVETEVTAQVRKIQSAGLTVSHLDTHKHTHMFPSVLSGILRAAKTCGIPALRNPFETVRLDQLLAYPDSWKRWLEVKTLHSFARKFHESVSEAGLYAPDGTVGIVATGSLRQSFLQFLLRHLPEGTWELVCHPGYNDAELQAVRTRLRESREEELRVLTSPEIRQTLAANGIELISYRQLVIAPAS